MSYDERRWQDLESEDALHRRRLHVVRRERVTALLPQRHSSSSQHLHKVGAGAARWGMDGALSVGIKSTLPLTITTFLDTGNHLQQSENPDWSYPPGHFMAFPLAVVDIQAEGAFSIELSFQP